MVHLRTLTLPESIRERIAMVRVLCIGFMIFVHVPDNVISATDGSAASVPLYSLLFQGVSSSRASDGRAPRCSVSSPAC